MVTDNYKEARSKIIKIFDLAAELEHLIFNEMNYEEKYQILNHYDSQIDLAIDILERIKRKY